MTDLVVVTAWRRPEFLRAAFLRLLAADDGRVRYLVALDRSHSAPVRNQAAWFESQIGKDRVTVEFRKHRYKGNSYNVLTSYLQALEMEPELVHLVEEDVLVSVDYLEFHRTAHRTVPSAFSVSACRNQQFPVGTEPPPVADCVYLHGSYQSIGVSFKPHRLAQVLRHANPSYFSNPIAYCKTKFPNTAIPIGNAEQDGLIHRVIEEGGFSTAYPMIPRAYHVGFSGYHRKGTELIGTIEQRAQQILDMSTDDLNRHALSYPDHVAVPLDKLNPPITKVGVWP